MLLALIWKFDFPPFMVLIIAILNDGTNFFSVHLFFYAVRSLSMHDFVILSFSGTIMTISKDRVKPSPLPDSWKLAEIFATGIILGGYLAVMTVIFFWAAYKTDFFPVLFLFLGKETLSLHCATKLRVSGGLIFFFSNWKKLMHAIIKCSELIKVLFGLKIHQRIFHVESLEKTAQDDFQKLASAVYLQVSTISQALIFVTRSRSWSFIERPGLLLVTAFMVAQLVSFFHTFLYRGLFCFATMELIGNMYHLLCRLLH